MDFLQSHKHEDEQGNTTAKRELVMNSHAERRMMMIRNEMTRVGSKIMKMPKLKIMFRGNFFTLSFAPVGVLIYQYRLMLLLYLVDVWLNG